MVFKLFVFLLCSSTGLCVTYAADVRDEFTSQFKMYSAIKELKVQFRQEKRLRELPTPLKSEGVLQVNRVTKSLIWQIHKPSSIRVEIHGDQIDIQTGSEPNTQRQTYSLKQVSQNTSLWKSLSVGMDFNPQKIIEQYNITKMAARTYQLEPRAANGSPFKKITIVAAAKGYLSQMEILEASDDTIIIQFDPPTLTNL